MPKRDFLQIPDLAAGEIIEVLDLAVRMKSGAYTERPLAHKTLASTCPMMTVTKSGTSP